MKPELIAAWDMLDAWRLRAPEGRHRAFDVHVDTTSGQDSFVISVHEHRNPQCCRMNPRYATAVANSLIGSGFATAWDDDVGAAANTAIEHCDRNSLEAASSVECSAHNSDRDSRESAQPEAVA